MLKETFKVKDWGREYTVHARFQHYFNPKNICLQLIDVEDGCPFGTPTFNLDGVETCENKKIILDVNNYPSCEKYLKDAGYIEAQPSGYINSGYVTYPVYKLTSAAIEKYMKETK